VLFLLHYLKKTLSFLGIMNNSMQIFVWIMKFKNFIRLSYSYVHISHAILVQIVSLMLRSEESWVANPGMTFSIEKRINTELFIDRTAALYMHRCDQRYELKRGSTIGTGLVGQVVKGTWLRNKTLRLWVPIPSHPNPRLQKNQLCTLSQGNGNLQRTQVYLWRISDKRLIDW